MSAEYQPARRQAPGGAAPGSKGWLKGSSKCRERRATLRHYLRVQVLECTFQSSALAARQPSPKPLASHSPTQPLSYPSPLTPSGHLFLMGSRLGLLGIILSIHFRWIRRAIREPARGHRCMHETDVNKERGSKHAKQLAVPSYSFGPGLWRRRRSQRCGGAIIVVGVVQRSHTLVNFNPISWRVVVDRERTWVEAAATDADSQRNSHPRPSRRAMTAAFGILGVLSPSGSSSHELKSMASGLRCSALLA